MVFRNALKMLLVLEMVLFPFGNDVILENDLICCALASEYPHFKSSPIDFTLIFNSFTIFCLIVSTTAVKRKH